MMVCSLMYEASGEHGKRIADAISDSVPKRYDGLPWRQTSLRSAMIWSVIFVSIKAHERSIECGPTGPDRDALVTDYHRDHKHAGVPPGSDPAPAPMTARRPIILDANTRTICPHPPDTVPALIVAAGERASLRFLEFFAANIRNPHTRRPCARAVAASWPGATPTGGIDYRRASRSTSRPGSSSRRATMRRRPSSCAWPRCDIYSTGW